MVCKETRLRWAKLRRRAVEGKGTWWGRGHGVLSLGQKEDAVRISWKWTQEGTLEFGFFGRWKVGKGSRSHVNWGL